MTRRISLLVCLAALAPATAHATDPERIWSTYITGSHAATSVAVDAMGNVYVTGGAGDSGLATAGTHQPDLATAPDAYLIKLGPDGKRLWGTYFGGDWLELGYHVAVGPAGNAVIVGRTISKTGIATPGALQGALRGPDDGFVAAFDPDGGLLWSTYLGGDVVLASPDQNDIVHAAAFDADGDLYVAGSVTGALPFELPGPHQKTFTEKVNNDWLPCEGFVLKLDPDSGEMIWGTYYGGVGDDRIHSIAVLGSDTVYISGMTTSAAGIATPGTFDSLYEVDNDETGFIARLDGDGVRAWGTYTVHHIEGPQRMAAAPGGDVAVVGRTLNKFTVATEGAYQLYQQGQGDMFLLRFGPDGAKQWGSYYGGDGADGYAVGVAMDPGGNILMAGKTFSLSGFASADAFQKQNAGHGDLFLARFAANGKKRTWGTYFGGASYEDDDEGNLVFAAGYDAIYFTGSTYSDGLATPDTFDPVHKGASMGVVARFSQHGLSAPCDDVALCKDGTCVDGVCCDDPCGGGVKDDCQTCLLAEGALADGVCTVQAATVVCRPATGTCDAAESCPGDAAVCPPDAPAADETPCDDGVCEGGACVGGTSGDTTVMGTSDTTATTAATTIATTTGDDTGPGVPTTSETTNGSTGGPTPTESGAGETSGAGDDTSTGDVPQGGDAGGCACTQRPASGDLAWLATLLLWRRSDRRRAV